MTVLVFLDDKYPGGRIEDPTTHQLDATNPALNRGDGVFETMLALTTSDDPKSLTVLKLEAHLQRLQSSAQKLDMTIASQEQWKRAVMTGINEYVYETEEISEVMVRLTSVRGEQDGHSGVSWITLSTVSDSIWDQRDNGVSALLLDRGYDSTLDTPWLLAGAKTLSYAINMAALRYAQSQGAEEVIFTSSDGYVLEGATSSILLARTNNGQKQLVTTEHSQGILPGTTQEAIFHKAADDGWDIRYEKLQPEDLMNANGLWLTSSVRLICPVTQLNGQALSVGNDELKDLLYSYILSSV